MRMHAIQTGSVAVKRHQIKGQGRGVMRPLNTLFGREWTGFLPIYAWAIEHPEGVIVVDTGETARVMQPGYLPRWHPYYRTTVRFDVRPEQEIGPQLRGLGIQPDDVRWVLLTHMHTDHAGGLHHFPKAEILVSRKEYAAAAGFAGRITGYLRQRWPSWFKPQLVDYHSSPVGPFSQSFALTKAGDVLLVPTEGHSVGHQSVIVRDGDTSFFFAGDTSYTEQLMLQQAVDGVSPDETVARATLTRVKRFVLETPAVYLPSHDPNAARRLATRTLASAATIRAYDRPLAVN